jgi:hypothetical protein
MCCSIISTSSYLFISVWQDFSTRIYFFFYLSVAGFFQEASHFYTVAKADASLRGKIVFSVCSDYVKICKHFQGNINCQKFGNRHTSKSELFVLALQGIYRSLCSVLLKFESFKIKVTGMESVKTGKQLEGEIELKFNQEGERTVNSDSVCCVSVGTQCEQKKDIDSIIVTKCSYSDSEDAVSRYWEDSQMVSVVVFNILCTDSELVLWVQ